MVEKAIHILGKDWLTVDEAAFYCGVSISQFKAHEMDYGLSPRRFMGKKLYERSALYDAISRSVQWRSESLVPVSSNSPLAPYKNLDAVRRRPYKPRRKKEADPL